MAAKEGQPVVIEIRKRCSRIELDGVDLTVRDLSLGGKAGSGFMKTLSFTGALRIGE